MITKELFDASSIAIVGASNDTGKIGGKVTENLITAGYKKPVYLINPKESEIMGYKSYASVNDMANAELAIIAIPVKYVEETIKVLAEEKNTKAFIILSSGFSETNDEGAQIEQSIVDICNKNGASLIGPNCIGVMTPNYCGIFAGCIPELKEKGCDLVSGSGSIATFIVEQGVPIGLSFASIISVGNSAQIGVEDIVKYWDETFDENKSPKIKIIYIEDIDKPEMLLKHAGSLIKKGCRIAAIKSGFSDAGQRAAESHTGALVSSDTAVEALFKKAGIVRCYGIQDIVLTSAVFTHKELTGKNIAIITNAGGPGVMMADTLSSGGFNVPALEGAYADELLSKLYHGSSVANPIDFLATGTSAQLSDIIDYCENKFDNIDGMIVLFGSPGISDIYSVCKLLSEKIDVCKKPVYPVLPSLNVAKEEIEYFKSLDKAYFWDEVSLCRALANMANTPKANITDASLSDDSVKEVRDILESEKSGFLSPVNVQKILDIAGIDRVKEAVADSEEELSESLKDITFPIAMKVVGPVHKSDAGGVALHVKDEKSAKEIFSMFISKDDVTAVLIQPMLSGTEVFAGAKYEDNFGHVIMCGFGGIFIEVLKDTSVALGVVSEDEALSMIHSLRGYEIIEARGVNEQLFADAIVKLSVLLKDFPEIKEIDLNPLLGSRESVTAVDARIRVEL